MMVMRIAITPSLNASSRALLMGRYSVANPGQERLSVHTETRSAHGDTEGARCPLVTGRAARPAAYAAAGMREREQKNDLGSHFREKSNSGQLPRLFFCSLSRIPLTRRSRVSRAAGSLHLRASVRTSVPPCAQSVLGGWYSVGKSFSGGTPMFGRSSRSVSALALAVLL